MILYTILYKYIVYIYYILISVYNIYAIYIYVYKFSKRIVRKWWK